MQANLILKHTHDNIRITIEAGIVYLGFEAVNRKPLGPTELALFLDVVALCDAAEVKRAIDLCRKHATPGAVLAALEGKPDPKPRRPKRGEIRSVRYSPSRREIVVERW